MRQYLELLSFVKSNGQFKDDRTKTGTASVFGYQNRYKLAEGFPLLTTKRLSFKFIAHELLWFLSGSTDVKPLQEAGVTIWDEWATAEQCAKFGRQPGDLGPVYGHQWRNFGAEWLEQPNFTGYSGGFDQIRWVVDEIKKNPTSRRLIVTGWNPKEQGQVSLPPCHTLFQFYVQDGELSCHLYQRSADSFIGVPFNIASYALLTHMIAHVCGLGVGSFIHTFGDLHIYSNHFDQVNEQLARTPGQLPVLKFKRQVGDIFDFKYEDFDLQGYNQGYNPQPSIKAPVAV